MPRSHSLSGLRGEGTHLTSLIGAVSEGVNLRKFSLVPSFCLSNSLSGLGPRRLRGDRDAGRDHWPYKTHHSSCLAPLNSRRRLEVNIRDCLD